VNRRLPLADLVSRRDRATVLPPRARKALAEQISRHGCYPAVIVRPHPTRAGKYEILDGHQRAEILRGLGQATARCEVWPIDSAEADVVAATLNRLRGRQDVARRARQVRRLARRLGRAGAADTLGMTPRALEQSLAATKAPRCEEPAGGLALQAVVFHLSTEDAALLQEALREAGLGKLPRAKALLEAVGKRAGPAARGR
jgi:ParB family chromosome partitioning protein